MSEPLNILVVGAGMYVAGRGADGFGTVLPTLVQAQVENLVGEIHVAATSKASVQSLYEKLDQLNQRMETTGVIHGYPTNNQVDLESYRQALAAIPQPAAAIVVVPDHLHATIAEDIIRAGLHLLVVKPLVSTLAEACQLITLLEAHNVYGAVEFHKHFDEANLLLRQTIVDGRLGELCYITVEYSQRRNIRQAFKSWIQHTNIFQYLGVHYADLIYYVTSAQPVRVLATAQTNPQLSDELYQGYDSIQTLIEWKDSTTNRHFVSSILTNWIDPDTSSAMSDQKITVVGTQGRYQSDQKNRGVQIVTQQGGVEDINPYFTQFYANSDGTIGVHGYGPKSIRQFLNDVSDLLAGTCQRQTLISSRPSFQDSLVATAIIEAVNHSLNNGNQWVSIEELWNKVSDESCSETARA